MKPLTLDQIGWNIKSHISALWWLGLLYRRPKQFESQLKTQKKLKALFTGLKIFLHFLPYLFIISFIGKLFIFELLNVSSEIPLPNNISIRLFIYTFEISVGIVLGIIVGIIFGLSGGISLGIVIAVAGGITVGTVFNLASGITFRIAFGIIFGITFGIAFGIAKGIKIRKFSAIACGIASVLAAGVSAGIADGIIDGTGHAFFTIMFALMFGFLITMSIEALIITDEASFLLLIFPIAVTSFLGIFWVIFDVIDSGIAIGCAVIIFLITNIFRLYYQPIHFLFLLTYMDRKNSYYRFHPVSWDDLCIVPFLNLHLLLLRFVEIDRKSGIAEIDRLIENYPSHRQSALRAKKILVARDTSQVSNIIDLEKIVALLPEGKLGSIFDDFDLETSYIKNHIYEICQAQKEIDDVHKNFLRERKAADLINKIEYFKQSIATFKRPLASEFTIAAQHLLKIAEEQLRQIKTALIRETTYQVFRAGDPVNRDEEAFIPRRNITDDLDKQLTLSTGCPGIVLYGRRRMGKSTILKNLQLFIPDNVKIVFISMEKPDASSSLLHFIQHIIGESSKFLPEKQKLESTVTDLVSFFDTLSRINEDLKTRDQRLILALDEYEYIDHNIGSDVFPENLLATLRESIQSHRQIIWLFAGRHEITELRHAPWTSFLVSVRTLEVPAFSFEETRLLLTEPMKNSSLWARDAPNRPRFQPEFWGENGIERIHQQTAGWPHLVQLVAETSVDLINDTNKKTVDDELFEQALDKAIISGHNVFSELLLGESKLPGEWDYLSAFRRRKFQPPPEDEQIYRSLRRRLLVAEENDQWCLRVPLMERWLRKRG